MTTVVRIRVGCLRARPGRVRLPCLSAQPHPPHTSASRDQKAILMHLPSAHPMTPQAFRRTLRARTSPRRRKPAWPARRVLAALAAVLATLVPAAALAALTPLPALAAPGSIGVGDGGDLCVATPIAPGTARRAGR